MQRPLLLLTLPLLLCSCTISEHSPSEASSFDDMYETSAGSSTVVHYSSAIYVPSYEFYSSSSALPVRSSSSAIVKSSSSVFINSSAYIPVSSSSKPVVTSTFSDPRGGTYHYVTIGSQVWMAENLNYASADSYCYKDQASYCATYGRMYSFESAQDACPSGWHLPSYNEWAALNNYLVSEGYPVASSLKSREWGGTDKFGFGALAGGYCYTPTYMGEGGLGGTTRFWTSTKESMLYGYAFAITNSEVGLPTQHHEFRAYVRCIKN